MFVGRQWGVLGSLKSLVFTNRKRPCQIFYVLICRISTKETILMTLMKQRWQSNVNNEGNDDDGDGRDGNGDGNGNSNDAVASTNGNDVYDNNSCNLRMVIGRQWLDNNNGTTTMWRQLVAATCRMLASAEPPIQGNNQLMWTVWGGLVWSSSLDWPPRSTTTTKTTKQHSWNNIEDYGNDGNGRDGNGDGDGNGQCRHRCQWQQCWWQLWRRFKDSNRTTAIGWGQWDDNNVMAMGSQQHEECLQVLRHPSKASIN